MDDTWLQIDQQGSWDIMLIISLVKEHIFSIFALGGVGLKDAIGGDTVLSAQLLPEFVTD
jgi:hypothetical protein